MSSALHSDAHYRVSHRTALSGKFRYGSNYPLTRYVGQQRFSPEVPPLFGGSQPLFHGLIDQRNTLPLPAYARFDFRADRTFTWANRRVSVFAEVANVLNRTNLRNAVYGVDARGQGEDAENSLRLSKTQRNHRARGALPQARGASAVRKFVCLPDGWHRSEAGTIHAGLIRANCEDHVHHVYLNTPAILLDDLKTVAAVLRERVSALLRRMTVQHVSGQWVEQHRRDAAKQLDS